MLNLIKSKLKGDMPLYIALFLINVMWLCVFLQMTPLGDDWGYVTTPLRMGIDPARLFDGLIGVLLRSSPFLFPWFNRVLLVVLHFVNCVMFYKFAVNIFKQNKKYSTVFTILFSISPWIYAAIAQTDGMNNLMAFTPGIIGTYLYFKTENETRANIYYIVSTALALCGKESGAAFLAVIPAIILVKVIHGELDLKVAVKRIFRSYVFGIILFLIYFKLTFSYSGSKLASQSLRLLISRITFPLVAFTGVNTFDVYNGLWLNAILGFVLSAPLIVYSFANFCKIAKNKDRLALIAIMLFVFGELFLLPIQLLSNVTDMHLYLFAFFALLLILYFLPKDRKRLTAILIALYFISFAISNCTKIYWQNVASGHVREFQMKAAALIGEKPNKLCVVSPKSYVDRTTYHYPAVADNWFSANSNGRALYPLYGYDTPISLVMYEPTADIGEIIEAIPKDYTIFIVYTDKTMKVVMPQ